jgi:translation initiation factor IF-3
MGVITTREAMSKAREQGLDLVEVASNAHPPVCRIMDYGKYKYEQGKKERAAKKHQTGNKLKEIKFHVNVADHDYQTKIRHVREFLDHGNRVKCSLFFRGRENAHRELGFEIMQRVVDDIRDVARIDQPPKLIGRSIIMQVTPQTKVKS